MAKIRYTIRLYRLHDLDLITFALGHEFNVIKGMYTSISALANGDAFIMEIPPRKRTRLPQLNRVYIKALTLDSEKDKKAVAILSDIAPGYRNSFLKNLLRLYLCAPLSDEYFRIVKKEKGSERVIYETPQDVVDEKNEKYTEMFGIFRKSRKTVIGSRMKGQLRPRKNKGEGSPAEGETNSISHMPVETVSQTLKEDHMETPNDTGRESGKREDILKYREHETAVPIDIPDIPGIDDETEPDSVPQDTSDSNGEGGIPASDDDDVTKVFSQMIF